MTEAEEEEAGMAFKRPPTPKNKRPVRKKGLAIERAVSLSSDSGDESTKTSASGIRTEDFFAAKQTDSSVVRRGPGKSPTTGLGVGLSTALRDPTEMEKYSGGFEAGAVCAPGEDGRSTSAGLPKVYAVLKRWRSSSGITIVMS